MLGNLRIRILHTALGLSLTLCLAGCGLLPLGGGSSGAEAEIATAVTDINGLARVSGGNSVVDFQVLSGLSGERLTGVQIKMAVWGQTRLLYASDPAHQHLPVAVPVTGGATVRRLIMPAASSTNYNIVTVSGIIDPGTLEPLGSLTEEELRQQLSRRGRDAVLLYLYNPARPLALTGAALEVFETPIENVLVLRAAGEANGAALGMVVVPIGEGAYESWTHRAVDRYLAPRVGQPPALDPSGDLSFNWAYPVFEVFPLEDDLVLSADDKVTLRVNWRSQNPDPPPPWSFFVSSSHPAVTIEPENFPLEPGQPPQEITLTLDRSQLTEGEHDIEIFIQPFSDTFGLIEQSVTRVLTVLVADQPPTPTPGPGIDLTLDPTDPREGGTLTVTAAGFDPDETVLLEFIGAERTISDGLATATSTGDFRYEIDLRNTPPGSYTLRLTGAVSGLTGTAEVTLGSKPADAIVQTGELNVRTGPGYDYPVLEIVVTGDELEVVGTNDDDSWIEIVTSTGVQGWVVTDLVELFVDLADVPWNPNVPPPP